MKTNKVDSTNAIKNSNIPLEDNPKKEEENISIWGTMEEEDENSLAILLTGVLDEVIGDGAFTSEEAKVFVTGEFEIKELIKEAQKNRGFLELLTNPQKCEQDVREKYAKEHPEYAKVMEEGKKVEKLHENALKEAEETWQKNNPEPESKIVKGDDIFGLTYTEEYANWLKKKKQATKDFESHYIKNNPDYANLIKEQNKNKGLLEILLRNLNI